MLAALVYLLVRKNPYDENQSDPTNQGGRISALPGKEQSHGTTWIIGGVLHMVVGVIPSGKWSRTTRAGKGACACGGD